MAPATAAGVPALGDRRLVALAGVALARANVRYWLTVAPLVRGELVAFARRARAIGDPEMRALALEKLHGERFNAEAAAMLATLAPRAHRGDAARAIVALELLFDQLDGLSERPSPDPLRVGERLFGALADALDPHAPGENRYFAEGERSDDGHLQGLSGAVRVALARLPTSAAIAEVARAGAARGAQAQIRMHAAPAIGAAQLEGWARSETADTGLHWRELLAGAASSVLALHALIAAAADRRTTPAEAVETAEAYLSICVLLTLLDSLVDRERDVRAGERGYADLYAGPEELAQTLAGVARGAAERARALRDGPHHVMTLTGVVAYYASAPGADGEWAQPVLAQLRSQLAPLITPTLAIMQAWRLARHPRLRGARRLGMQR